RGGTGIAAGELNLSDDLGGVDKLRANGFQQRNVDPPEVAARKWLTADHRHSEPEVIWLPRRQQVAEIKENGGRVRMQHIVAVARVDDVLLAVPCATKAAASTGNNLPHRVAGLWMVGIRPEHRAQS